MAVVYFVFVVPFAVTSAARDAGLGAPAPSKTCRVACRWPADRRHEVQVLARATFPSIAPSPPRGRFTSRDNRSNAGNAISKRFRSAGLSRSSRELSPMVRSLQSAVSTTPAVI